MLEKKKEKVLPRDRRLKDHRVQPTGYFDGFDPQGAQTDPNPHPARRGKEKGGQYQELGSGISRPLGVPWHICTLEPPCANEVFF